MGDEARPVLLRQLEESTFTSERQWPVHRAPGKRWRLLQAEEAADIALEVFKLSEKEGVEVDHKTLRLLGVRARQASYYPGHVLVELLVGVPQRLGVLNAIYGPSGLVVFPYTSPPFHRLNQEIPIRLSSGNAQDYAQLFCRLLAAQHGCFQPVVSALDIAWSEEASDQVVGRIDETIRRIQAMAPPPPRDDDDVASMILPLVYSQNLFSCEMRVRTGGMVEMTDDECIESDLPVVEEAFSWAFRWLPRAQGLGRRSD